VPPGRSPARLSPPLRERLRRCGPPRFLGVSPRTPRPLRARLVPPSSHNNCRRYFRRAALVPPSSHSNLWRDFCRAALVARFNRIDESFGLRRGAANRATSSGPLGLHCALRALLAAASTVAVADPAAAAPKGCPDSWRATLAAQHRRLNYFHSGGWQYADPKHQAGSEHQCDGHHRRA
jgi:hypothetical protein